jgi:hypothetical protein
MMSQFAQRIYRFLKYAHIALHSPNPYQRLRDLIISNTLFNLPISVRKQLFTGQNHFCPICETPLNRFLNLHRPYHRWCPICRSLQRHRLVYLFLKRYRVVKPHSRVLHFAPEPAIRQHFLQYPHLRYVTTDVDVAGLGIDVCADITKLPFSDHTFDLILCMHVLEHVADDRQAMRELHRVLHPAGLALIMVPITVTTTVEDPTITDPVLRERLFGQFDHVRRYGNDVVLRLAAAGFTVKPVRTDDIVSNQAEIDYMGLPVGETLFVCQSVA